MTDPVEVGVDLSDFDAVIRRALSDPDTRIGKRLKREIAKAGDVAAEASRKAALAIPSKSGKGNLRRGIAAGIKVAVVQRGPKGNKEYTARITVSPAKVEPRHRGVVKAMATEKRPTFRHPVFAGAVRKRGKSLTSKNWHGGKFKASTNRDKWAWVEQPAHPYFGSVILSKNDEVRAAIRKVLDDFIAESTRRG